MQVHHLLTYISDNISDNFQSTLTGYPPGRRPQHRRLAPFRGRVRSSHRAFHVPGHHRLRQTGGDHEDEERGEGAQRHVEGDTT